MASPVRLALRLNSPLLKNTLRSFSQAQGSGSSGVNANVPGLSSKCLKTTTEAVGPGAKKDGTYKNPEYFLYNENSYFEAEVEMAKYRIPQPSNKKK